MGVSRRRAGVFDDGRCRAGFALMFGVRVRLLCRRVVAAEFQAAGPSREKKPLHALVAITWLA